MRPCRQCNTPLENQQRVCPKCGADCGSPHAVQIPPTSATPQHHVNRGDRAEALGENRMVLVVGLLATLAFPCMGWMSLGGVGLALGCVISVLALFTMLMGLGAVS